jgi:hypothetical protein
MSLPQEVILSAKKDLDGAYVKRIGTELLIENKKILNITDKEYIILLRIYSNDCKSHHEALKTYNELRLDPS